MPKKVKKKTSSMPFSLSRWFRKISTAQPSTLTITITAIILAAFFFSGGLYSVTMQPYFGNIYYLIYSRSIGGSLGDQFVTETAISNTLYVLGFIGLLAIYQSTKYAYKPRQAYMMLVIGVALLLLAYLVLERVIDIKLFG